jgi:hypothetical protein
MSLEHTWILLESVNYDANQKTQDSWNLATNVNLQQNAIQEQSACFRSIFKNFPKVQRQEILYWLYRDDEFQDYFKCLFGEEEFSKEFL